MKIVSWNCGGAFRNKFHTLERLKADIYVIQECEDPTRSTKKFESWAGNHLWLGKSKNKGIGVFSRTGARLKLLGWKDGDLQLFLPCRIDDRVNLLGVWTKHAKSPNFRYIGQLWKYLQLHKNSIAAMPTIVCGDLNSNQRWDEWDRWWNHTDVVRELEEIGLESLYHKQSGEAQGQESTPTLFLHRKLERPYHIDYAFAPDSIIEDGGPNFWIGDPDEWLSHSDHVPLTFNVTS